MNIIILSDSEFLGETADSDQIEELIRKAFPSCDVKRFAHFDIIEGGDSSGRVFCSEPFAESVPLPPKFIEEFGLATLLNEFVSQARYPDTHDKGLQKGWEFRRTRVDNKLVLITLAKWVC